jgi:probable F420-dependent oxidoreductase
MDVGFVTVATAQSGDLAELARTVETLGYESLWIPEHPVIPVHLKTGFPFAPDNKLPEHYGRWVDPFIALTVAATATKRIKLGTCICLLPEREPLITAKMIATLDYYSGGRLLLGVGAGWLKEETEVMGTKFGLRWKRARETIEAMRVLWTKSEAAYEGEMVRFSAVRCEPKPVQKPYPPALLGAHGPKALERVARTYDGWIPLTDNPEEIGQGVATIRKLAKDYGRDPNTIKISVLADPHDSIPSKDELMRYRDAGVTRVVIFSQKNVAATADGAAIEQAHRFASVVECAKEI